MNDVHLNHFKLQWFTRKTKYSISTVIRLHRHNIGKSKIQIGHNAGLKIGFKELGLKIITLLLILSVSDLKSR